MDPRTYVVIDVVGVSPENYAEAAANAVHRASETLRGLGWFEITELRGLIRDGEIVEFQTPMKIGFRLLEKDEL
jgi:flavin-binding protein dodecin